MSFINLQGFSFFLKRNKTTSFLIASEHDSLVPKGQHVVVLVVGKTQSITIMDHPIKHMCQSSVSVNFGSGPVLESRLSKLWRYP